jgi:hypothetical protein
MRPRTLAVTFCCVALMLWITPGVATEPEPPVSPNSEAFKLLTAGPERPNEVEVRLRPKPRLDRPAQPGDRVVLDITAHRSAYVTVFSVSPEGEVTLLHPVAANQDNPCEPGRRYTLWDADGGLSLVLSNPSEAGGVVVFLTAERLELSKAGFSGDRTAIGPHAGESERLKDLLVLVQRAAEQTPWFNRVALPWGNLGKQFEVRLQSTPSAPPRDTKTILRALPPRTKESTPPEPVTGAAGARPEKQDETNR